MTQDPESLWLDLDVQLTTTSLTGQAEFRSDDIGGRSW